jgi:hypothetical protein
MTRPPARYPRTLAVAAACGLLVVAGGAGCRARETPPGGAQGPKAEHARKQLEVAALDAVKAAAESADRANPGWAARAKNPNPGLIGKVVAGGATPTVAVSTPAPPAVNVAPAPLAPPAVRGGRSPARAVVEPLIKDLWVSGYGPTEAEAEKDAFEQAPNLIEQKLKELNPPVRYRPSVAEAKAEFLRKDSRSVEKPTPEQRKVLEDFKISPDGVYVRYEVVVTPDQVRALRSHERVFGGLRVAGGLAVAALAGFLFLRIDEWTKGYLTSWLALAAFGLAGGAAAALLLV